MPFYLNSEKRRAFLVIWPYWLGDIILAFVIGLALGWWLK